MDVILCTSTVLHVEEFLVLVRGRTGSCSDTHSDVGLVCYSSC